MKKLLGILSLICVFAVFTSAVGCKTVKKTVVVKKDNGKHLGWYKNKKNPHNPNTTNPGNNKDKGKSKGKGKIKKK